jgi:hypothetical protein
LCKYQDITNYFSKVAFCCSQNNAYFILKFIKIVYPSNTSIFFKLISKKKIKLTISQTCQEIIRENHHRYLVKL